MLRANEVRALWTSLGVEFCARGGSPAALLDRRRVEEFRTMMFTDTENIEPDLISELDLFE